MHIFLTGEKQVGKTTIIQTFLKSSGKSADGFVTYWEPQSDGERYLYLSAYRKQKHGDSSPVNDSAPERFLLATDKGRGAHPADDIVEIFNIYGSGILAESGICDYIVMDELGTLESKAAAFQTSILKCLDGDVPVLGVLRAASSPFLDQIRVHPNVRIIEVTSANRTEKLQCLIKHHQSH